MGRAIALVDVESIRLVSDDGDRGAGIPKHSRRNAGGRSVSTIEHHMNSRKVPIQSREQMHDIAIFRISEALDAPHPGTRRNQSLLVHGSLNAVLDLIGQLCSSEGKELDAVIGRGVVRSRNHDTKVKATIAHEERAGGGGNHSGVPHIDSRARQPR